MILDKDSKYTPIFDPPPFHQQIAGLIMANADQIDSGHITMNDDGSWSFHVRTKATRKPDATP